MSDSNNNPDLNASPDTMYHRVGGQSFFVELVDKFYEFVEADTALRSMYPADLTPGKSHLAGFLSQYWGGPADYSEERGHPKHMRAALDLMSISSQDRAIMLNYFENTATMMINR
jgi:hemoglobin